MHGKSTENASRERISFWRHDGSAGAEFLNGSYRELKFAPHAHDRDLFALITRGALEITDPKRSAIATTGQVILYNHDHVHWGRSAGRDGWSILSVYVPPDQLDQTTRELGNPARGTIGFPSIVADDPQLAQRISTLCNPHDLVRDGLETDSLLLEILADVLSRHADRSCSQPSVGRESRGTRIARAFIDDNYASNLSLHDLSALCGIGRYWLIKAFKNAYGIPPYAYLTNVRVRHALRYLRDGMRPAEAAAACGFADQSHLSRMFKRSTGLTPGRFKVDRTGH